MEPGTEVDRTATLVIESAFEVHRILGPGLMESAYEEAMCVELGLRKMRFQRQEPVAIDYKGFAVGHGRVDLIVGSCVVVELKAVEKMLPLHLVQVRNYLRATHHHIGLLINFNVDILLRGVRRIIRGRD